MKLIIATGNLGKVREYRALLKSLGKFDLLSLRDFPDYEAPEEIGDSFEEIATLKATHAAKHLGALCLADDSGLVVPALEGRPGIFSARYAGAGASDAENLKKLIGELTPLPEHKRIGIFECAIALADSRGQLIKCVKGQCEGQLIVEPRGRHGFGYDPIFVKYDYGKTLAELDEDIKNRISHRRKAFDKLLITLETVAQ